MRPAQVYHAIRVAMLLGVLLFGFVTWFMQRSPDWTPTQTGAGLVTAGQVLWALAAIAVVFLFVRVRGSEDPAQRGTITIVAWAVGETLALYGAVVYFLSGQPAWYGAGVVGMVITFVAFPPPAPT